MPPPVVYRFEPKIYKDGTEETWENYINRVSVYFKLSVAERTTAVETYKKYVKDGVSRYCAGYMVLREYGLYDKMKQEVANLRPHRTIQI